MVLSLTTTNNDEALTVYSFNCSEPQLNKLPSILILAMDGYRQNLLALEQEIEQPIDTESMMTQVVDSLKQESSALTELDYCCLALLDENKFGHLYREFNAAVSYVRNRSRRGWTCRR